MTPKQFEVTVHYFKEMMQEPEVVTELEESEARGIGIDWLSEISRYVMEEIEKTHPEKYLEAKAHVENQSNVEHLSKCFEQ